MVEGLTTANLGKPNVEAALRQHSGYVDALRACGWRVDELEPADAFPDSTFVEDAAIVVGGGVILTRPGAESRRGEVDLLREHVGEPLGEIVAPGTLDGGDVCELENGFLVGLSDRTNAHGAEQLVDLLRSMNLAAEVIDLRGLHGLLHLKTGLSYLGDGVALVHEALDGVSALAKLRRVVVPPDEAYAANAIRVRSKVLLAAGYPVVVDSLRQLGFDLVELPMGEFQKLDGGLSCLSLRFA